MKLMAIDASTKSTGIAIYNDKELIYYTCLTATSPDLFRRIDKILAGITELLDEYKIDTVALEDVYIEDVHGNRTVFTALIYLQGFIMKLLNDYKIKPTLYTASEWRKKCCIHTGRGVFRESLKPKDIEFVRRQFGLAVNDDIADAICLGFAATGGELKFDAGKSSSVELLSGEGFEFGI